jgi:hypothetical protein
MVHHLALDVEHWWFWRVMAGGEPAEEAGAGNAWHVPEGVSADQVLDLYRREIARADEVIAATSLDQAPAWWPEDVFGSWRLHSLREIVVHVITETATHAGHLDAVRELIDGTQWLVLG